jgi:hypothetical protein
MRKSIAPSTVLRNERKNTFYFWIKIMVGMVDPIGIEPMTSSLQS